MRSYPDILPIGSFLMILMIFPGEIGLVGIIKEMRDTFGLHMYDFDQVV